MSREVPFDKEAICDFCGAKGSFDFMGDYLCPKCAEGSGVSEDEAQNSYYER